MKKIIAGLLVLISMNSTAQNSAYTKVKDKDGIGMIYNGRITFDDLDKEPAFNWLKSGYESYKPNEQNLSYLRRYLNGYTMVVFLGTWCSDSRDLIPKLEKILRVLDFPQSQLTMYGVDMEKKTSGGEHKIYSIEFVPAIILFKGGKEAGRITESVNKSIEADLEAIIRKASGGY